MSRRITVLLPTLLYEIIIVTPGITIRTPEKQETTPTEIPDQANTTTVIPGVTTIMINKLANGILGAFGLIIFITSFLMIYDKSFPRYAAPITIATAVFLFPIHWKPAKTEIIPGPILLLKFIVFLCYLYINGTILHPH